MNKISDWNDIYIKIFVRKLSHLATVIDKPGAHSSPSGMTI